MTYTSQQLKEMDRKTFDFVCETHGNCGHLDCVIEREKYNRQIVSSTHRMTNYPPGAGAYVN